MNTLRPFIEKVFLALRVHPLAGGLEISDSALRFAHAASGIWRFSSVRLAPGIIEHGMIRDKEKFSEALVALRTEILGSPRSKEELHAFVSLSSANVYSQVFALPILPEKELEKAVALNLQMSSPIDAAHARSGSQIVGTDEKSGKLEVLGEFVEREAVESLTNILEAHGFTVTVIESRALSVARLLRELGAGFEKEQSAIILTVDEEGIEFLVLRSGELYFRYFTSWKDIQGEGGEISWEVFEQALVKNLGQLLSFYGSHWPSPPSVLFMFVREYKEAIAASIQKNFPLEVKEVVLTMSEGFDAEWAAALGAGLRSLKRPLDDKELSLLGMSAREEARRHQMSGFLGFWRVGIAAALLLLLLTSFGFDRALHRTRVGLEEQVAAGSGTPDDMKQVAELEVEARTFNRLVTMIEGAIASGSYKTPPLGAVYDLFKEHQIILTRLATRGANALLVGGEAESEEKILLLVEAMKERTEFQDVSLPLSDIHSEGGRVAFTMTFSFILPNTP